MPDPFDIGPGRDELVARHLRAHLDAGARDEVLLARIRADVRASAPESGLDVLARWLRPGLAAAAMLALATALWLSFGPAPVVQSAAVTQDEMALAMPAYEPGDADALFAAAMSRGQR